MASRHLILYDGECDFCSRAVAWVRRKDRRERFDDVPFQDAPSPPMTPALRAACASAVHVITADGRVLRAGRACLFVLDELGWRRFAMIMRLPPLVWGVEAAYRLVAAHRPFFARFLFRPPPGPRAPAAVRERDCGCSGRRPHG